MKTLVRAREVGGSLMVTIPKEIVKEESILNGQLLEIVVRKPKKSFFGAFKGIGKFTKKNKFASQLEEN